jgi:hypothetical protein
VPKRPPNYSAPTPLHYVVLLPFAFGALLAALLMLRVAESSVSAALLLTNVLCGLLALGGFVMSAVRTARRKHKPRDYPINDHEPDDLESHYRLSDDGELIPLDDEKPKHNIQKP